MLKGSTRFIFSRILGVNKFHLTPVIMTQLEKDNLLVVLNKPALRDFCYYEVNVKDLGDHLTDLSAFKYEISLTPRHNAIKNIDRIVYGVKSVSSTMSIYMQTITGASIMIF